MPISIRNKLNNFLSDYKHISLKIKEEKQSLIEIKEKLKNIEQAQSIAQQIAEQIQTHVHNQLTEVVTKSLESVYDNPYEFLIQFEKKRGKTEAKLVFRRDGYNLDDPKNEAGVGQIDIASLALRSSCIMLMRPKRRRLLILDEPLRNVNGTENRKRAANTLQSLAYDLGFQIIMATGYDWLQLGKMIEIDN